MLESNNYIHNKTGVEGIVAELSMYQWGNKMELTLNVWMTGPPP